MNRELETERSIGLLGATSIGVGAIVGGGILALAGVAFSTTGPAAMLAFGLNGAIALLTALTFAEMASKFPESGGTYAFSKKVLSVEAAFAVGWVVWFASIVAAVLYASGFAHFSLVCVNDFCSAVGWSPNWLATPQAVTTVAVLTTALLAINLMRSTSSGGQWVNFSKVLVFIVLIGGGLWAVSRQPAGETRDALQPFFTGGVGGLFQAMGYTFIAMQGFDLIAAVGGEVREPSKTLPRAMILSLGIALLIYLPLLFVIATVGTSPDKSIAEVAADDPEGIIAVAAHAYLGPFGYWLVIVAAILSMFSALQANLYAAARIAHAMARDRTLPVWLSKLTVQRKTPSVAIFVTTLLVIAVLLALPDIAQAGAAASLIFLVTFALAHWIGILVRMRSVHRPPPFRLPLFPVVSVVGGLACVSLAVFQGIAVPTAGAIAMTWLSVGGLLFLGLFARRARVTDAARTAFDPELSTLRGRTPLVLVPIANPQNADAMIALADALVPADAGRVLLQTVVVAAEDWNPDIDPEPLEKSQEVLRELLRASARLGVRAETLTTIASRPMDEIARVARLHRCGSVLLGLSGLADEGQGTPLELLLGALDADVVLLRARPNWQLSDTQKVLVPIAGRGGHGHLRAALLSSLSRQGEREVRLMRVLQANASAEEVRRARRDLKQLAMDEVCGWCDVSVVRSDDTIGAIVECGEESDLLVLGAQRLGRHKKLFGNLTRQIAKNSSRPIIVISRRR